MLIVPEAMAAKLQEFVAALFTGQMRDPEVLARALQSLALAAIPEAQAARALRQEYRRIRDQESLMGDAGWSDRSTPGELLPFARKYVKDSARGTD
jgi:hypothetical protein